MEWKEVTELAKKCFTVSTQKKDLAWAERMWSILGETGLLVYRTDEQKLEVIKHLLCLSNLYYDLLWLINYSQEYYEDYDYHELIRDQFPDLWHLIEGLPEDELFESISSNARRCQISDAIENWLQENYQGDQHYEWYFLEDLLSSIDIDRPETDSNDLNDVPFEYYDNVQLFREIQTEERANMTNWFFNGAAAFR